MEEKMTDANCAKSLNLTSKSSSGSDSFSEDPSSGAPILSATLAGRNDLSRLVTAPRSTRRNKRSKYNATKHAIFAKVAVLKGESQAEFDSLLNGFREDFQPVGTIEEALVEKLATLYWRYRRMLIAEGAEISKAAVFIAWDDECGQLDDANLILLAKAPLNEDELLTQSGLIRHIGNPKIAAKCVELLKELHNDVETKGLNEEAETPYDIVSELYGEFRHVDNTVRHEYEVCSKTAGYSEEERKENGYPSPKKCVARFLQVIEAEIKRIENVQHRHALIRMERTRIERLRSSVPDSPALDRLLRYETTLGRAIDRTLSQLERIQRLRLGQPVPPQIKVDLSG